MRNKIINIAVLVFLICTSIITLVVLNKNKGLEKLVVFGQEIEIIEGKTIYVESLENRGEKIDSAVVTNGAFVMQGVVENSSLGVLKVIGENNKRYFLFNIN